MTIHIFSSETEHVKAIFKEEKTRFEHYVFFTKANVMVELMLENDLKFVFFTNQVVNPNDAM